MAEQEQQGVWGTTNLEGVWSYTSPESLKKLEKFRTPGREGEIITGVEPPKMSPHGKLYHGEDGDMTYYSPGALVRMEQLRTEEGWSAVQNYIHRDSGTYPGTLVFGSFVVILISAWALYRYGKLASILGMRMKALGEVHNDRAEPVFELFISYLLFSAVALFVLGLFFGSPRFEGIFTTGVFVCLLFGLVFRFSVHVRGVYQRMKGTAPVEPTETVEPTTTTDTSTVEDSVRGLAQLMRESQWPEDITKAVSSSFTNFGEPFDANDIFNAYRTVSNNLLPPLKMQKLVPNGKPIGQYIDEYRAFERQLGSNERDASDPPRTTVELYQLENALPQLRNIKIGISIPEDIRDKHHLIMGGSGAGKTTCIEELIAGDIERGSTVIVVDSQNELINKIATRLNPNDFFLIDPMHCAPSLNMFGADKSIGQTTETYEYIFNSLGLDLTGKQRTLFGYLMRLMFVIPGANLSTLRDVLQKGSEHIYERYLSNLPPEISSFFTEQYGDPKGQFKSTRDELFGRVAPLILDDHIRPLLSSADGNFTLRKAIDERKHILISTAQNELGLRNSSFFGRIFISQIFQAISEGKFTNRTYCYIDEFQEYADDNPIFHRMFEQSRKRNVGLIAAMHRFGQMPKDLQDAINALTDIKFASKLSSSDTNTMAKAMRTPVEFIDNLDKYTFAANFADKGTFEYTAVPGVLDAMPVNNSISDVRELMRLRYGPIADTPPPQDSPDFNDVYLYHPEKGREVVDPDAPQRFDD